MVGDSNSTTPAASQFPDPIPGILTFGTVNIFAGAPGVGKTAMLAEWIARWRDGRTICGKPTQRPTAFAYIAGDRSWDAYTRWFSHVGFPDIPHYTLADDHRGNLQKISPDQLFLDCLAALHVPSGAHVFLDPLAPLFILGDQNKARDVALSLLRLTRICRDRQITLTCISHFAKQRADTRDQYRRPQDRISGSTAFVGFSDTQIYLVDPEPPQQPHYTLGWCPRHAPAEEFSFAKNEHGLFVPFNLFTEIDRQEAIFKAIPADPTATALILALIQKETGVSRATAERYLSALIKDGRVVRVRRGFYKRAKPS